MNRDGSAVAIATAVVAARRQASCLPNATALRSSIVRRVGSPMMLLDSRASVGSRVGIPWRPECV